MVVKNFKTKSDYVIKIIVITIINISEYVIKIIASINPFGYFK